MRMKRHTRTRSAAIAAAGATCLLLAACGGGETGGDDASAGATDGGADAGPTDLTFASLDQGSAWYNYAVSIGQMVEPELGEGSVVEVLTYAGSIGNPELVSTGEADLATSFSAVTAWAVNGEEGTPFEGEPMDNLRVLVGGLDQYYFGPITPASSGIDSIRDAVDEEMALDLVSQPRASLGDAGTQLVLRAYGASVDDVTGWGGSFEPTSTDVATNAIRDGNADLWIQAITEGHPNITELAETSDIKILPIDDEAIEALQPLGLEAATLPGGTFRGQDEDVQLIGFTTTLIASDEMSEEVAYQITKTVVEGAEQLVSANASMSAFDPATAWTEESTGGVQLHPGAERYYREAGLMD
ncbi:TAXI family TRAP transporter solute-binding subunit [Georgenia wangjunii]|uniref:TAXI family TRAP transporter solute-binding subunit n=1 Tax=Georgenia wangjunii TaxID=3117730 RepID=UPI002F25FCB6